MSLPSGNLRSVADPTGAPVGGSKKGDAFLAGEEGEVSSVGLSKGEEEVAEEPRLPEEPCFAQPPPIGYRLKVFVQQLASLASAASAVIKSIGSRGTASLRGGLSSQSVSEGEDTGPVDQAQLQASAAESTGVIPGPNPSGDGEVQGLKDTAGDGILDAQVATSDEGETGEIPQLPKEPCASKPDGAASSSLKRLLLKAAAAAATASLLLKDLGVRGVASVKGLASPVQPNEPQQPVEAGTTGGEQLNHPVTPPSPLEIRQPGSQLPHPDELISDGDMA